MSLSAYSPKSSWGTVMSPAEYLEQFSYEDGRLAATGRKMFHLYDALCRPAVSGLCEDFLSDSDWGRVHDIPAVERTVLSSGVASDYNFSPSSLPAAAQVTRLWYYDRYLPGMEYAHGVEAPLGLPTAERTLVLDGWTAADTAVSYTHLTLPTICSV